MTPCACTARQGARSDWETTAAGRRSTAACGQEDVDEDTGRILALEAKLRELGVAPAGATPAPPG